MSLIIEPGRPLHIAASTSMAGAFWPPPGVVVKVLTLDESFAYARHIKLEAAIAAMQSEGDDR